MDRSFIQTFISVFWGFLLYAFIYYTEYAFIDGVFDGRAARSRGAFGAHHFVTPVPPGREMSRIFIYQYYQYSVQSSPKYFGF